MFESRSHEWSNRWYWNPLPLLSFAQVSIKKRKTRKKEKKEKREKSRSAWGTHSSSISGIILGACGNLSSSISGIILGGMGTPAKESTFAFKSCIESMFGPEVSWDSIAEKC